MSKSALIIVDMVRDFTDPEGLVYYPQKQGNLTTNPESAG